MKQELRTVRLDRIVEGENPRRHFDPGALRELEASLERHGMLQPVVVRRVIRDGAEAFALVAGERRVRAARNLGWTEVPAVVHAAEALDDEAAFEAAMAENVVRADMSPAEEARAVKRVVEACGGDVAEAVRRIGRSERFVRSRLALLHCADEVLDALTEGKIPLGVAELLAGVPETVQRATLPKIIEQKRTVSELRQGILSKLAQKLATAKFDTAGCAGCPRNSTTVVQQDLFGETLGEGYCQDPACWREKTLDWVRTTVRAELAEDFARVAVEGEDGDVDAVEIVFRSGPDGVGDAQYRACLSCGNYGAVIRTAPGKEGETLQGVCFDPACLKEKKAAHRASVTATDVEDSSSPARGSRKAGASEKPAAPREAVTAAVYEEADRLVRDVAADVARTSVPVQRALMLVALLREASEMEGVRQGEPRADLFRRIFRMPEAEQTRLLLDAFDWIVRKETQRGMDKEFSRLAAAVLDVTETSLKGKFRFTESFLRGHRKAALVALLEDSGFARWYTQKKGEKGWKALKTAKVAEIIKTVLESGFDPGDYVPPVVQKHFEDRAKPSPWSAVEDREPGGSGEEKEAEQPEEKEETHAAA